MKYLRQFADLAAYNTAKSGSDFFKPCVSLIEGGEVLYDPLMAAVGDYLFSDLSYGSEVGSKTPIGLCVAPRDHFSDRRARFISLVNMSATDPEHGTTATGNNVDSNPGAGLSWGPQVSVPGIFRNSNLPKILATSSEAVTDNNPIGFLDDLSNTRDKYIISDYNNGLDSNKYPFNSKAFTKGLSGSVPITAYSPYPFAEDGSRFHLFGIDDSCISYFNGKRDTKIIWDFATEGKSGTITKTASTGNYPAAVASYRFNAGISTLSGEWYLPSLGELSYTLASINLINTKLDALSTLAVKVGVNTNYGPSDTTSTLGGDLWSSSEYGQGDAWRLNTYGGSVDGSNKNYSGSNFRVRAFIAR